MSQERVIFVTNWIAVKETARGFHYLERKGKDSVAVFLLRKRKPELKEYEVLIRQQPLCIDNLELNGKPRLYPCPITGGIGGNETPEESGFSVRVLPLGQYIVGTQTNEICYLHYADVTGLEPEVTKQDGSYFESVSKNEWHPFEYLIQCDYSACQIGYLKLQQVLFSE